MAEANQCRVRMPSQRGSRLSPAPLTGPAVPLPFACTTTGFLYGFAVRNADVWIAFNQKSPGSIQSTAETDSNVFANDRAFPGFARPDNVSSPTDQRCAVIAAAESERLPDFSWTGTQSRQPLLPATLLHAANSPRRFQRPEQNDAVRCQNV